MTDIEYQIVDELYFLASFGDLQMQLKMESKELEAALWDLISKGWVRMTDKQDHEIAPKEAEFAHQIDTFYFIVTKRGLMAHNQR